MSRLLFSVVGAFAALLIASPLFAAGAPGEDALKANGLAPAGTAYVLPDEAGVLKEIVALRVTKKEFDAESRIRKGLELRVSGSKLTVTATAKEYDRLKDRLTVVTNPTAHNRMILQMNQLAIKNKDAIAAGKEAEEKLAKLGVGSGTKYVDDVLALDAKAQAASKKYEELAADPAVKGAIAKSNRAAGSKLALGPSPEFATATAELAKYRSEIESEAIPLSEEGGVQTVSVLLNGEPFKLMLDPGASMVTLPREIAEKLKMIPGPQDPIIELRLADGHVIQVQQMTLKSVRVGRFTVANVSCAVMAPGLNGAAAVLGNSFLAHFVVKLDQKAGQLQLTEVEQGDKKPAGATPVPVVGEKPGK